MSKLSIRPRNLDACKFIPIYKFEEIPDLNLNDYASINRSIPQLPTGMEKEEESEHHLQQAISAQQSKGTTGELVIPTPEVYDASEAFYNDLYPQNFRLPRQLIHVQPFAFENDIPEYDRDSEDEQWLETQSIPNLTPVKFEELIDCFDKSSSQHVISLKEAKSLIKEDEDLITTVYDFWLNKRLRLETPLIPMVKTERRDTSSNNSNNNPYIAFRRRTEKMQTRKNRKNDEISYEKMIKLRRDLSRSLTLLQFIKQREETKKEHVKLSVDIFEKRYLLGDYNGNIINEIQAQRQAALRQASNSYLQSINSVVKTNENKPPRTKDADGNQPRKKREYRKRHRPEVVARTEQEIHDQYTFTSDDEDINDNQSHSISDQDEEDSDGPFAFKRKKGCQYYAPITEPLDHWPDYSAEERVSDQLVKKYCLTKFRQNDKQYFEYTRRRIGRGGRIIFDRIQFNSPFNNKELEDEDENSTEFLDYFRPKSPAFKETDMEIDDLTSDLLYIGNGNLNSSVKIDLNDYLHENHAYSDCRSRTDADLANFKNHQKELIEMQKLQKEKLLLQPFQQQSTSTNTLINSSDHTNINHHRNSTSSNNSNNEVSSECSKKADLLSMSTSSMCNNKFSSNNNRSSPIITNHHSSNVHGNNNNSIGITTTTLNSLNNTTSLPQQPHKLSSESVSFAVSAVSVLGSSTALNSSTSLTSQTSQPTLRSTNGPAQIEFNNNEKALSSFYQQLNQHSPSSHLLLNSSSASNLINSTNTQSSSLLNNTLNITSVQSQVINAPQWSNQTSGQQTNELTNSSNIFKLKFQTNNQNSITPTDVT